MKETTRTSLFFLISVIASYYSVKISVTELYRNAVVEAHNVLTTQSASTESDLVGRVFEGKLGFPLGGMLFSSFLLWILLVASMRFLFRKRLCLEGKSGNEEIILFSEPLIIPFSILLLVSQILLNINAEYAYWIIR